MSKYRYIEKFMPVNNNYGLKYVFLLQFVLLCDNNKQKAPRKSQLTMRSTFNSTQQPYKANINKSDI